MYPFLPFDTTKHDKDNILPDCTEHLQWKNHKERYTTTARNMYRQDEARARNGDVPYVSADLEKELFLFGF